MLFQIICNGGDASATSSYLLIVFVADVAEKNDIQIQYKQTTNGGNDAGAIQTSLSGVKTCVLSVPCRYIHSPVSMAKLCDIDSVYELMKRTLADINMF
jgi:endoglucanase